MAERTLTTRDLNRALLARQLLLDRVRLPIPRVLERMGMLQAQYAPSMYIGLWSRIAGFERAHLDRALEQRRVVQGTLMRSTIHLVSKTDYWPLAVAIRRSRREWWLRTHKPSPEPRKLEAAAARLRTRLASGPLRRAELDAVVRGGPAWVSGIGLWLDLVRVPPSGTWERRRADLYAAAEDWIGPEDVALDAALERLVRRYLIGFGPATREEIASWAGVPPSVLDPGLERLSLRRFRAEDGDELLDLPRSALPAPDAPAPVRFLPVWDATLLVHARRTAILSEEHRPLVFDTKTPHSFPTFLVDGTVAGTWRYEDGKIDITPFRPLSRSVERELRAESERLLRLFD